MRRALCLAPLLVVAAAAPARADLPKNFDWSDKAVRKLAETHPEQLAQANPTEAARVVATLVNGSNADRTAALNLLSNQSDLDRFKTFGTLDQGNDTTVRRVYDTLDASGQQKLLDLTKTAGDAGTKAGLQQVGIMSDCDDTAFPTQYTPNGTTSFTGSGDFYKMIGLGTDGTGDPGNVHYVTARYPALLDNTRDRLTAAGVPVGTFDGDNSLKRFLLGGFDGIQQSKEENIDLWMRLHPGKRFVLLGDTLQRDPEVYKWALANHPDQVEAVFIHKAGTTAKDPFSNRNPADYKGMVFFDDYPQLSTIAKNLGIPQPGARLPDKNIDKDGLPLPNTDVSKLTAAEDKEGFWTKAKDVVAENIGTMAKAAKIYGVSPVARAIQSFKDGLSSIFHKDKYAPHDADEQKTTTINPVGLDPATAAGIQQRDAAAIQAPRTGMVTPIDDMIKDRVDPARDSAK